MNSSMTFIFLRVAALLSLGALLTTVYSTLSCPKVRSHIALCLAVRLQRPSLLDWASADIEAWSAGTHRECPLWGKSPLQAAVLLDDVHMASLLLLGPLAILDSHHPHTTSPPPLSDLHMGALSFPQVASSTSAGTGGHSEVLVEDAHALTQGPPSPSQHLSSSSSSAEAQSQSQGGESRSSSSSSSSTTKAGGLPLLVDLPPLETLTSLSASDAMTELVTTASEVFRGPRDPHARLRLGRVLSKRETFAEQATRQLQLAVRLDPHNVRISVELARFLWKVRGDDAGGGRILFDLFVRWPSHPQVMIALSEFVLEVDGDSQTARDLLMDALQLEPDDVDAQVMLASLLLGHHDSILRRRGARLLRMSFFMSKRHAGVNYLLGKMARERRELREAEIFLRTSIQTDPHLADARYQLALTLDSLAVDRNNQTMRLGEVRLLYVECTRLDPSHADAFNELALLTKNRLGDSRRAEDLYAQGLRVDPHHPGLLNNLATLQFLSGRFEEAETLWRQCIQVDPNGAHARNNLANVVKQLHGDLREAEMLYLEAINLDPTVPQFYNNYGRLLQMKGQHGEAEELFRVALEMDPSFAIARRNLGEALKRSATNPSAPEEARSEGRCRFALEIIEADRAALLSEEEGGVAGRTKTKRALEERIKVWEALERVAVGSSSSSSSSRCGNRNRGSHVDGEVEREGESSEIALDRLSAVFHCFAEEALRSDAGLLSVCVLVNLVLASVALIHPLVPQSFVSLLRGLSPSDSNSGSPSIFKLDWGEMEEREGDGRIKSVHLGSETVGLRLGEFQDETEK